MVLSMKFFDFPLAMAVVSIMTGIIMTSMIMIVVVVRVIVQAMFV